MSVGGASDREFIREAWFASQVTRLCAMAVKFFHENPAPGKEESKPSAEQANEPGKRVESFLLSA